MIDKEYFIATMGFLIDTLGDTIENESVLGLCGSLILMFSWIFRAPESLFYGYMAFISNGDYTNYYEYLLAEAMLGDTEIYEIISYLKNPEDVKRLKTLEDLYDYLVGETKKIKLN